MFFINNKTYEVSYVKGFPYEDWDLLPTDAEFAVVNPDGSLDIRKEDKYFIDGAWQQGCFDIEAFKGKRNFKIVWDRSTEPRLQEKDRVEISIVKSPIKSDGGSSDYYKRPIPKLMIERWNNDGFIEAKDVMKLFLGNDYNFSNSFKAHCRVQSLREGVGKEGADEKYDLKKSWFFCEDAYKDHLERGGNNES